MKKLVSGIVDFRQRVLPSYRDTFARLALEQKPDVLFVACSDSRVVPNLFASSNPGDLFVVRNVGNLIPPCDCKGDGEGSGGEGAAIEFALSSLPVTDVVVCGHSECGAMIAIQNGKIPQGHLKGWLRHGQQARDMKNTVMTGGAHGQDHNQLSQRNVLLQLEHLQSYPLVAERIAQKTLRLHAWWFDIAKADVYAYDFDKQAFFLIDENTAPQILTSLSRG